MASTEMPTMSARILFVDDELPLRTVVTRLLGRRGVEVIGAGDAVEAVEKLREIDFDLVITDFQMPEMDGLELLAHLREFYPETPAMMMTGYASVQHAVQAMSGGAIDYLPKPFATDALADRVLTQIEARRNSRLLAPAVKPRAAKPSANGFVGEHASVVQLREFVDQIATSAAPVFIIGESGTGKEVLSRHIHQQSGRKGPFVALNCANLPRELVESALFGHRKGSFTGATDTRIGAFEEADGGTLLLDEVTEIDPSIQAKLLRVLQESEVQPVGANRARKVDVRVLATSNRNIGVAVEEGSFRGDLYHRLSVFPITIPPLRDRSEDVPLLANRFVEKYRALYGYGPKQISEPLMRRLVAADWPGNVRQLENVIHRGVVLSADRTMIEPGDIDHAFLTDQLTGIHQKSARSNSEPTTIDDMEREMILAALAEFDGNQVKAASKLGISDRTIRNKLKKYREDGFID